MNAAIFAFTRNGTAIALRLAAFLAERGFRTRCFTMPRFMAADADSGAAVDALTDKWSQGGLEGTVVPQLEPIEGGMIPTCAKVWHDVRLLISIGASGIAVRMIAPFLKSKLTDPAVLCIDEQGKFVIPLISGHIGGANALAVEVARALDALPVVTTGTDVNGLWAVDAWAAQHGLRISSLKMAKSFAAREVDGELVGVYSEFPLAMPLPQGLVRTDAQGVAEVPVKAPKRSASGCAGSAGAGVATDVIAAAAKHETLRPAAGVAISLHADCRPFTETVVLQPKVVHLGIGCRRNTPEADIAALVEAQLQTLGLSWHVVAGIASIDVKADEAGLLSFAAHHKVPTRFYSATELNAVTGDFTPSKFVASQVGVDNVCERAAVRDSDGGTLLLRKTAKNGVTVAMAVEAVTYDLSK